RAGSSPKVTTSLGQRWASGCLGMARSCSSTSENKAVINSTVIIRLSSPRRDVTPPSVEESSDDCKPKKLVPLVCKVLYMLYGLSETNTIGYYPDVQFGTAYFHDHVDALTSWKHGLFGALIAEPPGSTYHDPRTGVELRSGPVADIHTASVVSVDVAGSFRELVLFIQDDNIITRLGNSSGSSYNLRVEPLGGQGRAPPESFSSALYGDPETPVLEAQVGDPVVVRTLVAGTNDVHTWHVDGHWFRIEPYSLTSPPVNTVHLGISERFDLVIPRAGGPQGRPGDYLYHSGRIFKLREGSWGLLRVHPPGTSGAVRPLPGREATPAAAGGICPQEAARKEFAAVAVYLPLPMLGGSRGVAYILEKDRAAVLSGSR